MGRTAALALLVLGLATLAVVAGAVGVSPPNPTCPTAPNQTLVSPGAFVNIYDPSEAGVSWYVNDHTLMYGDGGVWHLYGITHTDPADPYVCFGSLLPSRPFDCAQLFLISCDDEWMDGMAQ